MIGSCGEVGRQFDAAAERLDAHRALYIARAERHPPRTVRLAGITLDVELGPLVIDGDVIVKSKRK